MYRIAICEDEVPLQQELRTLTEKVLCNLDIPGELTVFSNAEALETALMAPEAPFDLLLLDIQLGGKTGLRLAQERRGVGDRVSIIFTTGCEEYLREGYTVQPIQYLLKPVTPEALRDAIRTDWQLHHMNQTVLLQEGTRSTVLPIQEVLYLESINHGVLVHLSDRNLFFRLSLTGIVTQLPPGIFCRCHNSFLVQLGQVIRVSRSEVTLRGGIRIPIGRKYYASVQSALIRYMNQ